jgi:putative glutamine amidotransferase
MTSPNDIPTIAVCPSPGADPTECIEALERAGGRPVAITPDQTSALSGFGALTVCGEGRADETMSSLLSAALDADLPVLCIGAGFHSLNLAVGGRPAGEVDGHAPVDGDDGPASSYHRIFISPGSKLAAVVGSGGFVRVNSRHPEGLREARKSRLLAASAYSLDDGIVEALESPMHRWVIGVQFHPERRLELPPHFDRLFQSLVERAIEHEAARA